MKAIVVVGAGTMGTGIAQLAATNGCNVCLIDVNSTALEKAPKSIATQLDRLIAKGKMRASQRDLILGPLPHS